LFNYKSPLPSKHDSKKIPELKYFVGLLSFLTLLWGATLGWFHLQLAIHFSWFAVSIWFGLLLLTLVLCQAIRVLNKLNLQRTTQFFNLFWFGLLSWVMLINAGLLYETGGTINPLMHLLILPLALGMLILSVPFFLLLASVSALFYVFLSYFYVPIMSLKVTSLQAFFAWHLHGSMLVFMLLVLLLAILILPLKKRLESQRAALDFQRNAALQNEYLLSIASIASASAHQLSTPLNTLALLQPLLKQEVNSELGLSYLQTFSEQIQVCQQALQGLRKRANYSQHKQGDGIGYQQLVTDLTQEFALIQPKSVLRIKPLTIEKSAKPTSHKTAHQAIMFNQRFPETVTLKVDESFKLAIMNLLDNAARFSPDNLSIEFKLKQAGLLILIDDTGGGMTEQTMNQLGNQPLEAYHGIGMGVFLSRMIIERFSGTLTFTNIKQGNNKGLRATLWLPTELIHLPTVPERMK